MQDKVVLITGSSRGIGAATARLAAERGAKVVVHGKTDSPKLQSLANEIGAFKIFCDVADKAAVSQEVNRVVDKFGGIDVLVNSAGYAKSKPFLDLTDQDFYDHFNVNLLGTVHFCQAVVPYMNKAASIVNISSLRGLTNFASARIMPFSVSKAAILSLSIGLAKEYGPDIRVNCVAPGGTETDLAKGWSSELRTKYKEESLIKRIAKPEDVAKVILFLASDESSLMTGKVFSTDGGYEIYGK